MKKIVFRADGSSKTGLGHLYRIFALIEIFKSKYECVLVTKQSSSNIIPLDYKYEILPEDILLEQEPAWLTQKYNPDDFWVIADGYQFNSKWQKAIKEKAYKLVYVDDTFDQHMFADIVINHALSVTEADYKAEFYTRFALGANYAILRPSFLKEAKVVNLPRNLSAAFICFGGADPLNLTYKATQALLNLSKVKNINVVLGAAYTHEPIFKLASENQQIKVFQNLNETKLVEVMKASDFAIAPASTILYELCAVKMPIISGYYVENQKNIYYGCVEKELVFPAGNIEKHTVEDFEKDFLHFFKTIETNNYQQAQTKIFDGTIKERFLDLLKEINFRQAGLSDMDLVFNWANDKVSRANSYFSEPILFETHKNWFEKKLKDSNCFIYIAELENTPAGMVRYEIGEVETTVGILVSENFRGKGLATTFLKDTAMAYFKLQSKPIIAFIKCNNLASVKTFEKAGYKLVRNEEIHGVMSFVYKLEKDNVR